MMFILPSVTKQKACEFLNEKMPEIDDIDLMLEEFCCTGTKVFDEVLKAVTSRKSKAMPEFKTGDMSDEENESVNGQSSSRASTTSRDGRTARTATKQTSNTSLTDVNNSTRGVGRGRGRGKQSTIPQAMARASTRPSNKKEVIYMDDSD